MLTAQVIRKPAKQMPARENLRAVAKTIPPHSRKTATVIISFTSNYFYTVNTTGPWLSQSRSCNFSLEDPL